ncbi:MAG: hypothetical protein NUV55_11625 [Sulfuricaulis sp.]|uniref:hypothetical protein n=1 Tax=Sulfuricaulis sp. TaxID=2003553 RepID=UPI0025E33897|nr:hypothetical protein [Sulfuricaulis sp.]MCR4347834.1 hypothetical protein [Sulfuricaulis sp.]
MSRIEKKLYMPNTDTFRAALCEIFKVANKYGIREVTIVSGDLHRKLGGYPGSTHRMPVCCEVMKQLMKANDEIVFEPPRGKGATLSIRYKLPR